MPNVDSAVPGDMEWLLGSLTRLTNDWRRLCDLDLSGRTMIACLRAHLSEIDRLVTIDAYLRAEYTEMAMEFVQAGDDSFVTHNCLRTLYEVWQEEAGLLNVGPLPAALQGLSLTLSVDSPAVRPGRRAMAASRYLTEGVAAIRHGGWLLPVVGNAVASGAYGGDSRADRFWVQFLVRSTDTWAREIVVLWDALREMIAMRRNLDRLSVETVARGVADDAARVAGAVRELNTVFDEWRWAHVESVQAHDALPLGSYFRDIGRWLEALGPEVTTWAIKDPMKTEMYREVALAVAVARGENFDACLPTRRYWRATPWTPSSIKPGQFEFV